MQRLSERQLTDIHIFCANVWHTKYKRAVYFVCTEASMQVSIDTEALDTLLERAPSAGRLDDRTDVDEMVVGVLTAFVPLHAVDMSNPGGVL